MRVAVIGCGYWGSKHVRVLRSSADVDVVAVDPSSERRQRLEEWSHGVSTYGTLNEVLPFIDAAIVATPPETHVALGMSLLQAGKHVLIEKPLATSVDGARTLIDLAEQHNATLMAGHTFEYNPAVRALRDIVQSGGLGEVYHLHTARLNLGLYQHNVDVFWDLAPHDLSIANMVLDSRPQVVHAWGGRYAHQRLHDVGYIHLRYEELRIGAQFHVSWLEPRKVRRVTVVGSSKMAVCDDLADDERLRIYDKGVVTESFADEATEVQTMPPVSYRNGGISSPYVPFQEPLALEDEHFVHCIRNGERPQSDGYSGLAVVAVLEAAARSLAEDRAVEVDSMVSEPV